TARTERDRRGGRSHGGPQRVTRPLNQARSWIEADKVTRLVTDHHQILDQRRQTNDLTARRLVFPQLHFFLRIDPDQPVAVDDTADLLAAKKWPRGDGTAKGPAARFFQEVAVEQRQDPTGVRNQYPQRSPLLGWQYQRSGDDAVGHLDRRRRWLLGLFPWRQYALVEFVLVPRPAPARQA